MNKCRVEEMEIKHGGVNDGGLTMIETRSRQIVWIKIGSPKCIARVHMAQQAGPRTERLNNRSRSIKIRLTIDNARVRRIPLVITRFVTIEMQ